METFAMAVSDLEMCEHERESADLDLHDAMDRTALETPAQVIDMILVRRKQGKLGVSVKLFADKLR